MAPSFDNLHEESGNDSEEEIDFSGASRRVSFLKVHAYVLGYRS